MKDFVQKSTSPVYQILTSFEKDKEYEQLYDLLTRHLSEEDRADIRGYLSKEKLPSLSSDIISKSIFGKDTEISRERLNYLLRKLIDDKTIEVAKTAWQEGTVSSISSKKIVMDLPVTLDDNTFLDAEFQQIPQDFVFTRGDIYLSEMQLIQYSKSEGQKKGDVTYENVKSAVLIFLMKKSPEVFKEYETERYIHRFTTRTADTGMVYNTLGSVIYVQLDKCLEQLKCGKNGEPEKDELFQVLLSMMADINDSLVRKKAMSFQMTKEIMKEVEYLTQDKEVRKMLLAEKYVAADLNAALHHAKREAIAEERNAMKEQAAELRRNGKTSDEILQILFPKQPASN